MLALCSKSLGNFEEALGMFDAALSRAPKDPNLLGNYANLLYRMRRPGDAIATYRRLLSTTPNHGDGWMNLGLALMDAGDATEACKALQRAVELRPDHGPSWQAIAAARRNTGDLDGAEAALRKAVRLQAGNGSAWTALGVVRRLQGDPGDALDCYRRARAAGFTGPAIDDAEASALLDMGETRAALAMAQQLTRGSPGYAPGHALLAHILWEHGDGQSADDPFASFEAALAEQPANAALRQAFIRFLLDADAADKALEHIRVLRAQVDMPAFAGMEANVLEVLGQHDAAARLFDSAYPSLAGDAGFLNLYIRHLFRSGQPDAAAARALDALNAEPHNQLTLAYLGLAWRLTGDARESWLCGYESLVQEVVVEPPAGTVDEADFLRTLELTLTGMHKARREPVNQSVRGGSQTPGRLFGRPDPVIAALRDSIASSVSRYIAALPSDPTHPFLQRKSAGIRFAGSWSVRLSSSGRHVNHFHQEGWISSAYYVALPPSVEAAREGDTSGFLQFGEPPKELGLALEPRRVIKPRAGRLVLFPSYLWHGTVPFSGDTPRLTVAFDVQPQ